MRLGTKFVLALACVSFLAITLSDFHLHADLGKHDAQDVHESHDSDLHLLYSHDLDHEDEHVDVAVFEPASGFLKLKAIAPAVAVPEPASRPATVVRRSIDAPTTVPRRYLRLRPLLRAPPTSA